MKKRILAVAVLAALCTVAMSGCSVVSMTSPTYRAWQSITQKMGHPYAWGYTNADIDAVFDRHVVYSGSGALEEALSVLSNMGFNCQPEKPASSGILTCRSKDDPDTEVDVYPIPPNTSVRRYIGGQRQGIEHGKSTILERGGVGLDIFAV